MEVRDLVEASFGYAEMQVLSLPELYAGKICAALDRQHPRDFFDVKLLLENEGLTTEIRQAFLVYLISHPRPLSELINPMRKNIRSIFESDFANMTEIPVTVEDLETTREQLIKAIHAGLTEQEIQFLLSFKARTSNWSLLGLSGIDQLPAVKWKMLNLQKMSRDKHAKAYTALEKVLLTAK